MTIDEKLAAALNLPVEAEDEEVSTAIVALITSAVHDASPRLSLGEIYTLITNSGASSYLDPLNSLPHLICSSDPSARDIIGLIGECGPAKEVVMAVQEGVERLESAFDAYDEDEKSEEDQEKVSLPSQLVVLIELYASAISRLKLRRNSASDTIRHLLHELENTVTLASQFSSREEGIALLESSSRLAEKVFAWAKSVSGDHEVDLGKCQKLLESFVCGVLIACSHCVRTSIAQRTFEQCFPKLSIRSAVEPGWEADEKAIQEVIRVLWLLGSTIKDFIKHRSQSSLIILAHSPEHEMENQNALSELIPAITASIHSNMNIEESIALLLKLLHLPNAKEELAEDVVALLSVTLPPLASTHPDPLIRHQAFRILSKMLSMCPAGLRLQILVDLTSSDEYPQMRVAAVGLVKEAILEALESPAKSEFASPILLKAFGPVLFRPNPPDLFSSTLSPGDFQQTQEPRRLVECLALYYVLLMRDTRNLTGVRDKDVLGSIERSLLAPLRNALDEWLSRVDDDDVHDNMSLVSLQMSLERVDTTVSSLQ